MHGATHQEVRLDVPFQRVERRAAATDTAHRQAITHVVQDGEPVAGRRLAGGAVGPELRQAAREVAARHHVGRVRQPGGRVDRMTRAQRAPVGDVVVVDPVRRNRRFRRVAHGAGGNVPRHAVGGIEVRRPAKHHFHALAERGIGGTHEFRRRARIQPDGPVDGVAKPIGAVGGRQRERRHPAPLGRLERREAARDGVALLVDVRTQRQRLPAVLVRHQRVAARGDHHRLVDRDVDAVCVVVWFVRPIVRQRGQHGGGNAVADGHRIGAGGMSIRGRCAVFRKQRVVLRLHRPEARACGEAAAEKPVGHHADGLLARGLEGHAFRRTMFIHEARQPAAESAPRVPHAGGNVEEVARVHGRSRKVLPDRTDQQCVPTRRGGVLRPGGGRQKCCNKGSHHQNLHSVPHARQDDRKCGRRKPSFPGECRKSHLFDLGQALLRRLHHPLGTQGMGGGAIEPRDV